jgi:hypothetical protein
MKKGSIIREHTARVRSGNFYDKGRTTPQSRVTLIHVVIFVIIKFFSAGKFFLADHSYIISLVGGNFVLIELHLYS